MFLLATAYVVQPHLARAQGLTGALIGTVKDAQGGVLASAVVRVSSPALIGGSASVTTIERTAVLKLVGLAESVVVEGAGSRIEARDPGFGTRFGPGT